MASAKFFKSYTLVFILFYLLWVFFIEKKELGLLGKQHL